MPSLRTDGRMFFPNVLTVEPFRRQGYLYQVEPGGRWGLHWVVVDPRKHVLQVWRKQVPDFVHAAKSQNATVVTNGPFFAYAGGRSEVATARVFGSALLALVEVLASPLYNLIRGKDPADVFFQRLDDSIRENFGAEAAVGYIYSQSGGFSETKISTPEQHYFGRKDGREFAHYEIDQGDPPNVAEFIGGLPRAVANYAVQKGEKDELSNQHGFWGLAPLDPSAERWRDHRGALEHALETLATYDAQNHPGLGPLTGVLITVYQTGRPPEIAGLMAAANVKDAVQLDGSSSVLLGVTGMIVVGEEMDSHKRAGNTWGYKFVTG